MNKKGLIVPSVLVVILAMTGTSLALLRTESVPKNNKFDPGVLTAAIWENGKEAPQSTNIITPVTPGGLSVNKEVKVLNVSNPHEVDAYIRVMLVPTFRTPDGSLAGNVSLNPAEDIITISSPHGKNVVLKLIDGWSNNWAYDNVYGYFYYKSIVHPGEYTSALLQSVSVSDNELWNTFNLEVLSDSIQAENNAAAEWKMVPEVAGQLEQYK